MECWYRDCTHSSLRNDCTFRVMPADECSRRIWMRYARIIGLRSKCNKTPVVCSCHFNESSTYPTPFLGKRKLHESQSESEPEVKKIRIEFISETTSGNESDQQSFNEPFDQSQSSGHDFEPIFKEDAENELNFTNFIYLDEELVDTSSKVSKDTDSFAIQIDKPNIINFERNSEAVHVAYEVIESMHDEAEALTSESMSVQIEDLTSRIQSMSSINDTLQKENVLLKSELNDMNNLLEQKIIENVELHVKIDRLESRLAQIDYSFDFTFIQNSNEKVLAYTGLPSKEIFNIILNLMSKFDFTYVYGWTPTKISKSNQLLMTLMKLRMDLRNFDLAERFKCSVGTVSNFTWSHA